MAELLSQASLCGGRGPRGGLAGPGRPPRPGADVFLRVRLEFWGLRRLYNTFLRCGKLGSTKQKQNVKICKTNYNKIYFGSPYEYMAIDVIKQHR